MGYREGIVERCVMVMTINTYSLKRDGNKQLSEHFKVAEFKCRDCADVILVAPALVEALERVRERCGNKPVTLLSAYRTEAYNTKIGGAKASQHVVGTAADIQIAGIPSKEICKIAEDVLAEMGIQGGVGNYPYSPFVHIDVRDKRARWQLDKKNGSQYNVSGFGGGAVTSTTARPMLRQGDRGEAVRQLQKLLSIPQDGIYGPVTKTAVESFQRRKGLIVDGICGPKTWAALEG